MCNYSRKIDFLHSTISIFGSDTAKNDGPDVVCQGRNTSGAIYAKENIGESIPSIIKMINKSHKYDQAMFYF